MALPDRPDFQAWLERFEARHARLYGGAGPAVAGVCDGCGEPLPDPPSSTGLCLVCLAEHYGQDEARAATRVAAALLARIVQDEGTSIEAVRDAVDDILAQVELAR
ncbi:MAG: hypothetical protein WD399_12295 [Thermoleophilaceae bacterium]